MATTYYVENKRGDSAFIHTSAHTAAGIIRAAMEALDVSEGDYLYYTPDEVVAGIMDGLQVNRRRAVLYWMVSRFTSATISVAPAHISAAPFP